MERLRLLPAPLCHFQVQRSSCVGRALNSVDKGDSRLHQACPFRFQGEPEQRIPWALQTNRPSECSGAA